MFACTCLLTVMNPADHIVTEVGPHECKHRQAVQPPPAFALADPVYFIAASALMYQESILLDILAWHQRIPVHVQAVHLT